LNQLIHEINADVGKGGLQRKEMLRMESAQSSRQTSLMTGRDIHLETDRHFQNHPIEVPGNLQGSRSEYQKTDRIQ
jgi:hypothetical protein